MKRLLAVLLIVFGLLFFLGQGRGALVHFSGDLASDLQAGVGARLPGQEFTPDPDRSKVEFVSVTEWGKIGFVPGASDACGADCSESSEAILVRVTRIGPFGARKQVFLNINSFLSRETPGVFALGERGRQCLEAGLTLEILELWPERWPDGCLSPDQILSRFRIGWF